MKKLFAFLILLTMMLTLFSGCKEVRDPDLIYKVPLSEEMKEEINDVIKVNLDYVNYYEGSSYYGMINDCVIIRDSTYIDMGVVVYGRYEIAGYLFEWIHEFTILVYRDGESCTLQEAYEKGWLTKKQVEVIHTQNHRRYAERIRLIRAIDSYISYPEKEPLSEQKKQEISGAFLKRYNTALDWNNAYTFYGTLNYGTVNNCAILMTVEQEAEPAYCLQKIAHTPFEWLAPFKLYAYCDGEVCELQEAYDKGWFNRHHIELIRERNIQNYVAIYKEIYGSVEGEVPLEEIVLPDQNVFYTHTLSEDQKSSIRSSVLRKFDEIVRWGYVNPYYGTINECHVVVAHPFGSASGNGFCEEVAGYTFEWDTPIGLYVYRDGINDGACTLRAAYMKGWLTEEQIGVIHKKHEQYRKDFPALLEQWQETKDS